MREEACATLFAAPLDQVFVDQNFNVRIFYGDIDQLAVQLMTEGQREPIKVRRDGENFFVVDGHRRHRAFGRCRSLSIQERAGRFVLCDAGKVVGDAPGPKHPRFDPNRILCRLVDPAETEPELFASQMAYNSGKPFTLLERMIFLSRLARLGTMTREQLALKMGFSRTYITNALNLHAADPRLLEYVRDGRVSQKLALRLLKTFSSDQQIARIQTAMANAERHQRDKILPKDIEWGAPQERAAAKNGASPETKTAAPEDGDDPVRARLRSAARRLESSARFAPTPTARERLETALLVHRFAFGKLSYARLEAHLMGRD